MDRTQVLDWFTNHPAAVHDAPEAVLKRCEHEVRQHAVENAWRHAHDIAMHRSDYWHDHWGAHASESFVAREVCRVLATDLVAREPVPQDGHDDEFVDGDVLCVLEADAREILLQYVHDLALGEEHRAWEDVLRFTRERGRALAGDEKFSSALTFERTHCYGETAARVMEILARDFAHHARTR